MNSDEVLAGMSPTDRLRLISGRGFWQVRGVESASIPHLMVTDGPHGLRKQNDDRNIGASHPATCFPTASGLAATWDLELLAEVGAALGREAREADVGVLLGPGVNLKRHPGGGRNFEYFSEDPYLAGHLAAACINGVQREGVGTSLKHFAVNNQESFRLVVDVVVDERTLRELYLPAFEIAVRDASPWTIMCAYNRLGGTYCSDNHRLLTSILRDEWGFDGLVMSDWGATNDRAAACIAGMDLEMPGSRGAFDDDVAAALSDGTLQQSDIDTCAARVVELHQRAAAGRAAHEGEPPVDFDAHHQLARRAAADACVLLTNDGTLPLDPTQTIGVIGGFARDPRYQGAGSSKVNPTRLDNFHDVLIDRGLHVEYAEGYDSQSGAATSSQISEATALASRVDVVLLCVGLPSSMESEAFDRADLRMPDGHLALIAAVVAANQRTVVLLSNGAPVEMPWAELPAAIIEGYLGGQAGASGLADVVTGDINPAGRLAESIPVSASDLPADIHFPGDPRQVEYREGLYVGYRFHDSAGVPARFAFGHGLSYTSFDYGTVAAQIDGSGAELTVTVTVEVRNAGDRAGAEVVQCYVRDLAPEVDRPDKELKGFAKIALDAGESTEVSLALDRRAFAFYDVSRSDWRVAGGEYEIVIGSSSVDTRGTCVVAIEPDDGAPSLTPAADERRWLADDAAFAVRLGHPIPSPQQLPPFDRTVTIAELEATRAGRLVQRAFMAAAARQIEGELADDDEGQRPMVEAALREAPLRSIALMSGGKVSMGVIDGLVGLLNGQRPSLPAPLARLLRRD